MCDVLLRLNLKIAALSERADAGLYKLRAMSMPNVFFVRQREEDQPLRLPLPAAQDLGAMARERRRGNGQPSEVEQVACGILRPKLVLHPALVQRLLDRPVVAQEQADLPIPAL